MRDVLMEDVKRSNGQTVNLFPYLNQMTLDVIGSAGFNYEFDALRSDASHNELNAAFNRVFSVSPFKTFVTFARFRFPFLWHIVRRLSLPSRCYQLTFLIANAF